MSFSTAKEGSQPLTSSHVASLLVPKHTNHVLASEPSHWLSRLPGTSFRQTPQAWFPDLSRSLSQCHLLTILYKIALPPSHHSLPTPSPASDGLVFDRVNADIIFFLLIVHPPLKHWRHSPLLPASTSNGPWKTEHSTDACSANTWMNEWSWCRH